MSRKPNGPVTLSFSWPRHGRSRATWQRWFKAAATISTILVLIMLPRAAWAQRAKNDPHPEKPCVTTLSQTESMYRVAFHPWCDLRVLVRTFPVLNEAGKPLPMQEQLRNIYEANKDREVNGVKIRHTVMSGCTPTGSPSPDANEEERQSCSHLMNYYAAPANDSIAIIEVPRSRVLTYTEKLEKLSEKACTALSKITNPDTDVRGALESCRKMGIQTLAQVAPVVVDEQPQSKPPQTQSSAAPQSLASNVAAPQSLASNVAAPTAPAASASSAPQSKVKPSANTAQQSADDAWLKIMAASLILLSLGCMVLALLYTRERGKNMAPIKADFEKKLVKMETMFSKTFDELEIELSEERAQNARLGHELSEFKARTAPPVGQMKRDNEKLTADLATANAKVAELEAKFAQANTVMPPDYELETAKQRIDDLEFNLSAKAGEAQAFEGRIAALKKNLDIMTGERKQFEERCACLEHERDQAIQSMQAAESRAEHTKADLAGVAALAKDLQRQLDEPKRKSTLMGLGTPGLDNAELIAANLRVAQAEEKLRISEARVAELQQRNEEFEKLVAQNGQSPQVTAFSVRGYEDTIQRQGQTIKSQEDAAQDAGKRISELEAQLEQVQSYAQAKELNLIEIKQELKKTEEDLAEVGEANAELVSEKRFLEDELAAHRAFSAVKLAQDPPSGGPISTVKLADSTLSSTQDGKLTPEDSPQAKPVLPESDFPGLARAVERSLNGFAGQEPDIQVGKPLSPEKEEELKQFVASDLPPARGEMPTLSEHQDDQLTNPRMAIQPPFSRDLTDTIPPRPSSPPPVDFVTMPDEILSTFFKSSLMEVGMRRLKGIKNVTFEVVSREDVHCVHEMLNVPIVWSMDGQVVQSELGSPRILLDCKSERCQRPSLSRTPTKTPEAGV